MSIRLAFRIFGLGIALALAPAARAAVELVGETAATFDWAPADGPVAGYFVYVDFEGGDEVLYGSVTGGTRTTVDGSLGDAFRVSVAAFDTAGNQGPRSLRSELVTFAEAPPPPPPPDEPPPPPPPSDDPPADDPPADDPPAVDPPADTPPPDDPPADDDPPAEEPPERGPGTRLDFDGDGVSDLFQRNKRSGQVRIWKMDGSRVAEEIALPSLAPDLEIVGNGDHDGDGRSDALCLDPARGQLEVWLVRGDGVAGRGALGERLEKGWEFAGSGDYDGDGHADVLLRNGRQRLLEVWYLDGTQVAEVVELEDALGRGWKVRASGDYDGDGIADVLWQHRKGELRFWRLGESVEEVALGELDPDLVVVGSADTSGDGRSDLLLRSRADGGLALARVGRGGVRGAEMLGDLKLQGTGDYDGDGYVDLLVKDRHSRKRAIYFMEEGRAVAREEVPSLGRGWYPAGVGE